MHGGILGQLRPEYRSQFKKASAKVNGQMHYACWIEEDGVAVVIFEDGEMSGWALKVFKEEGA